MPPRNKTIYVNDEDYALWEEGKRIWPSTAQHTFSFFDRKDARVCGRRARATGHGVGEI
jgi:hypothetical protein